MFESLFTSIGYLLSVVTLLDYSIRAIQHLKNNTK